MPRFSRSFRRQFRPSPKGGDLVILWPDTFNNYLRPRTAMSAARLLEAAGFQVSLPAKPLCWGGPLYDWGYLDAAKKLWEETFATLKDAIAEDIPVIGLEPACTSAFKDELPALFPSREEAAKLSSQVVHITDFVSAHFDRFSKPEKGGRALVQAHCHHHAVIGFDSELQLLDRLGVSVDRPPQGCCRMAGAFGFASETPDLSRAIGERVLLPAVREAPADTIILADGFSCREQIEQGTGRATLHIAELMAKKMIG